MARISLCVIARDEEAMIPGCLSSVDGVVDEVIVLDTGSRDATREMAEAAGARVRRFPWCDDFSAARNAALEAATGDWILVLDADERLAPGAGATLRRAVEQDAQDCGMLPLHNADRLDASPEEILSGVARRGEPILLPRLLKRTPDLKWEGVVHESVADWITRGGRRVRQVNAPIIHFGAVQSVRVERRKDFRNLRLLERQCELSPDDPVYRTYLARELVRVGQNDRARAEADVAWEGMAARVAGGGPRPSAVSLATLRAFLQLHAGEFEAALETLQACAAWGYEHPNLELLAGAAHEQIALARIRDDEAAGRDASLRSAREAFERCLTFHGQSFAEEVNPGATSWAARARLGTILLLEGRPESAWPVFDAARTDRKGFPDAELGMAEAVLAIGDPGGALKQIEPHMALERPDPWILAAFTCDALGQVSEVALLARRARELRPKGLLSAHRDPMLSEMEFLGAVYGGAVPAAPPRYQKIAALMGRRPLGEYAGASLPAHRLRQLAGNLLRSGRVDRLEALVERRAEALIPGICDLIREVLAHFNLTLEDDGEPDFVFIGGAGRSGTTLFRAMLAAHPVFYCGPEVKLVTAICKLRDSWLEAMGPDLAAAGVDESVLDGAVRAFVAELLTRLGGDAKRVAEKTPHNALHISYLGRIFPRARFVHVIRDGRAVANSLVKQRWADPSTGEPVWYCRDHGAAARYWAMVVARAREQAAAVPGRYLEVRYEDLVTEPRAQMQRVLAFLGEPWDDAVLAHEAADVGLSALESSSAAVSERVHTRALTKWRKELGPERLRAIDEAAGPVLAKLGYTG